MDTLDAFGFAEIYGKNWLYLTDPRPGAIINMNEILGASLYTVPTSNSIAANAVGVAGVYSAGILMMGWCLGLWGPDSEPLD